MKQIQQIALATSTAALSAALVTGCGALSDAPISNAKANDNTSAIQEANSYGTGQQAQNQVRKVLQGEEAKTEKKSEKKAEEEPETKAVEAQGGVERVVQASSIPAWVTAINFASSKLGTPYVWGGDGHDNSRGGYDCSGLTKAAYAKAGITLPRVANDQYGATNIHPKRSELAPGDLIFFGPTERGIHHVAIYVGKDPGTNKDTMLHAPRTGRVVSFDEVDYMDDYYGATRVTP